MILPYTSVFPGAGRDTGRASAAPLFLPAPLALILTSGLLAYQGLLIHRW